ncbi:hypothetical protein FQA47_000615 [Oryzias melastigma]|uniref:Uncharacterized protein n=1 Tax=Oryzias melastigma TaxID=30732 RepID=A0A834F094_ORYME|nr:hypothetical protein FQA47_000615 [Oryzias melastigma]
MDYEQTCLWHSTDPKRSKKTTNATFEKVLCFSCISMSVSHGTLSSCFSNCITGEDRHRSQGFLMLSLFLHCCHDVTLSSFCLVLMSENKAPHFLICSFYFVL